MSEKPRDEEPLSFKEQILRDLEKLKQLENENRLDHDDFPSNLSSAEKKPSEEIEKIAESLSAVDQLLDNAPTVPPRSTSSSEDGEKSIVEEKPLNATPTKVSVSYRTHKPETIQEEATVADDVNGDVVVNQQPLSETVPPEEARTELPSRSRREASKSANKTKKKKTSHLKGFLVTLLVLVVLLGAAGFFGYQYAKSSLQPVDADSKQYVTVQIPDGANTQQIGKSLENSGLIKNSLVFTLYVKYKNYSDLKSGYYNLKKSMSTEELIKELQKGGTDEPQEPVLATLTIPEGYTIDQIAQTVGQLQGDFKEPLTAEAFLAKVQDETFINQEVSKYPNLLTSLPAKDSGVRYRLEGYIFPATYDIKESTTVESLIDDMLAAMDKNLSGYYTTIKDKNLTVNELLTIASLVEKEGSKTEDRKLIAGVFYNRLNQNMPLQSNIAILYAEGKLGQDISLADDAAIDTTINSPYNVYTTPGLMPGPVDSPSLDAIESSINQTKSENLYFVANVQDGKVYYATTREEHDRNVAEHVNSKISSSSSSN